MIRRPLAAALTTVFAAAALSACAGPTTGPLDAQTATPSPTCRVHQTKQPALPYTAGAHADTISVLQLMHYYTANGTKAFCDGKPPTDADRQWTDLYTRLGGAPAHLSARTVRTP
ncbi:MULTISPECIES: hypothetical protein [unclassified Streptomyces]|uniref:hypothetical protein n=1 Tax=unclassified Streptomyces TaxID=2593676 RepID=UPI00344F0072